MNDSEVLLKTSLDELKDLLQANAVVGQPIEVQGYTIIPLLSIGLGFGAGGGNGLEPQEKDAERTRAGAAVGGGIKPIAVIIVGPEGVKIETLSSSVLPLALGKLGNTICDILDRRKASKQKSEVENQ